MNINLHDLMMDQKPGKDLISYSHIGLLIGEINGNLQRDKIKYINLKDSKLTVDSLKIQKTPDTLIYHFTDYSLGLNDLDLQTEDSIFHLTMQSFQLSYNDKSVNLKNLSFQANISNLPTKEVLSMKAGAYIENKVYFNLNLGFSYLKPEFSIDGMFGKFDITDLNKVLEAYAPAKINKGTVDKIEFSGIARRTEATGTC